MYNDNALAYDACERCIWYVRTMHVENENSKCHLLCSHQLSSVAEEGSTFVCHCQMCQVDEGDVMV